jgi:hypothetical protein
MASTSVDTKPMLQCLTALLMRGWPISRFSHVVAQIARGPRAASSAKKLIPEQRKASEFRWLFY